MILPCNTCLDKRSPVFFSNTSQKISKYLNQNIFQIVANTSEKKNCFLLFTYEPLTIAHISVQISNHTTINSIQPELYAQTEIFFQRFFFFFWYFTESRIGIFPNRFVFDSQFYVCVCAHIHTLFSQTLLRLLF